MYSVREERGRQDEVRDREGREEVQYEAYMYFTVYAYKSIETMVNEVVRD
jgi:hypothetical protein